MPADEVPLFDPTLEVAADRIEQLSTDTLSRRHISGLTKMCWAPTSTNPYFRYSFVTGGQFQLEIHFSKVPQLDLQRHVLICLKGVNIEPRPTLKHPKLPFKLVFPKGVILQLDGQIRDTFPVEPPSPPAVPSWFESQPLPPSSPVPSSPIHASSSPHRPSSPTSSTKRDPSPKQHAPPVYSSQKQLRTFTPVAHSYAPPPSSDSKPTATAKRLVQNNDHASILDIQQESTTQTKIVEQKDDEPEASSASGSKNRPKKKRRKGKKSLVPERNPALDMTAGCYSPLGGKHPPLCDLADKVGTKVSVIGVVRGISLPKSVKSGDWFVSTELLDPSNTEQTAYKINLFLPESSKDCIPSVKAGDILMLRKLSVARFNNAVVGTGYTDSFQWAGYSPSQKVHFHSTRRTFLDEEHCFFFTPDDEELAYAARLADWWSALQELAKTKPDGVPTLMSQPKGRSLITLSEAKVDVFFNCVVEILYGLPPGDQCAEIFVTDYTINNLLFTRRPPEAGGTQDKTKVYGKRVLKVVLWGDTQIAHAQELETPGYYYIDNLRVRFDSKGYLEGTLQDNRRKIDKLRSDDPLLPALLQRRQEYIENPQPLDGAASQRGMGGRDANLHSAGDLLPPPALPMKRSEPKQGGPEITRLSFYNIVRTPIQKVFGHPACPEVFRIRARIVAFEPYKLENFSVRYCTKCRTDLSSQSNACHECADFDREYVAYEYRFQMVVEEEGADVAGYRGTLIVDVSGEEAELFLSGLAPADLWKSKKAAKLRQRIAPVLGNLEAYQLDIMTDNSLKAITRGQYFDMLIRSHISEHKNEGSLDNRRYKLWGTELIPANIFT
ncbi:C, briggsae CBR-GCY-28 protein [Rhizoctonia solani AG-1 IB]|uniref:Protection of telomeres protein 1 n=1 Tax=Thanatephorus cucumeris (strain AG1-IB / isolate 7/3/14) TaxID=1108050 RepID=A0A0B7F6A3_THACB|nr:C, briggsae CBR-GCY-28 protein [Rhizoctonia solani AG-1 IB]